ncbi:MAG: protoglobin domain-containing protein, partial [Vulcanimicrobiaceae bacterium]
MSNLRHANAYGPDAGAVLVGIAPYLDAVTTRFVTEFYDDLATQPGQSAILSHLTADEFAHLQARQSDHLRQMFMPALDEVSHRASARAVGKIHALTGVEPGWIVDGYEHYRRLILDLSRITQRDYRAFREVLDQRLSVELHEQLDAPRELQQLQHAALQRIDLLVATSTTFIDLASGVLDILISLDGIETGAISRPDSLSNLQYEVTAGE